MADSTQPLIGGAAADPAQVSFNPDGTLLLVTETLRDMALNNSSRFLYVQAAGRQEVLSFRVDQDGNLTLIDTEDGLPFGAQGIAAK